MMLCFHCGKEISEGAKFCPHCGAIITASASDPASGTGRAGGAGPYTYSYGAGVSSPASPPSPPEKRGKKGLIIGGCVAAAVIVIALLVVALSGLFSSPKDQVEKALIKTIAAHAEARGKMGLPDMTELTRNKSVSQRLRMELTGFNSALIGYDLSALEGLGLSVSGDYDQQGRKAGSEVAAFWGDNEILSFQMLVDDNVIGIASPQLTKGEAYGLDTETLGKAMVRWGMDPEDEVLKVEEIGFNLFDLVERYGSGQQSGDEEETIKEATLQLAEAIVVEKAGKKTIDVNGKSVNAAAYLVTIPQDAMEAYVDALEGVWPQTSGEDAMEELLRAFGVNEAAINEITSGMMDTDSYGEMAGTLKEMLQNIGDVELNVYLDGGYVCAMECAKEKDGSKLELGLYLGGGDSYVDDVSFRIAVDGTEVLIESSGSHGGKDGVFTDSTVLRVSSGGSSVIRLGSDFSYVPEAASDNFDWSLNVNNMASVKMMGQLTAGKDSLDLQLDKVSLKVAGMEYCSLAASYSISPCRGVEVSLPAPRLLGDMDLDDLEDLYYDIEYNAEEWVYDVMAMIPSDLLWALL